MPQKIPHWDDVAEWAARELQAARTELELSDVNGDKNRGRIAALRELLDMPDRLLEQHNQQIRGAEAKFQPDPLSQPPEYV